ncbi:hypothetical protein [Anaerocolumna sp. MB42-C2]|uniref:hypothetical protein n=1 Tax=Anaerocolumna sp. MB42-C2 TaxID=3070997 RepID=UPI0027E0CFBA|nr:hypothetical protein [Anaerocolumna sp. MB42-C2]WMJ88222.1 hypothetical protein RBU59_01565 [Anaerocolumna sp. MB42-C2]
MKDAVIKCLERDRKRAVKVFGEKKVITCLSEKTEYQLLCEIYSELQNEVFKNHHIDEVKWLKGVIEKTIFSKVMEEHGYTSNGNKIV